jgi:hypothetical protein
MGFDNIPTAGKFIKNFVRRAKQDVKWSCPFVRYTAKETRGVSQDILSGEHKDRLTAQEHHNEKDKA